MQIPPIDVTRLTLRAVRLLDHAKRALLPEPRKQPKPNEPDRRRPDSW